MHDYQSLLKQIQVLKNPIFRAKLSNYFSLLLQLFNFLVQKMIQTKQGACGIEVKSVGSNRKRLNCVYV